MLVVRAAALGGIVLLSVSLSAQYPIIPRGIYLKIETQILLRKINPHLQTVGTDLNTQSKTKPTHKSSLDWLWKWLNSNLWDKLDVSGQRTLGLHAVSVQGDSTAYDEATNYGEGGQLFTDDGTLSITGRKVFGVLSFQAELPDNRLSDPTTQNYLLEYDKGNWKISEGDIRGSLLGTNALTSFSRSVHGTMVEYHAGKFHAKAIYSETKGTAQTVSIPGSNSEGPYFLESGRILPDTLSVMVNGVVQRPGVDYVLNGESSDSGSITFLSQVIPPSSTIVATFESVSPGSSPGVLTGAGATYDLGKFGQVGASVIEQLSTGSNGDGSENDLFVFAGAASPMYLLSYTPIPATVQVQLNGLILPPGQWNSNGGVVGGDWALNPADPQELFLSQNLTAPPNATLYVKYQPVVTQTVQGDRQVYGFDYAYKLGKTGSIQYSQATGQTVGQANGEGGTGRVLNLTYLWKGINFTGNWKDIPSDYVSIETEGFNRNEESYTLGADAKRGRFDYGITYGNAMVDNQETSLEGTGTGTGTGTGPQIATFNARSTSLKAFASYSAADGTTWSISQSRTAGHQVYNSSLDDSALAAVHPFGKQLKLDTGIDYQTGTGPLINAAGSTVIGDVDLLTYHIGATYTPFPKLVLDGKISESDTRALGQDSTGDDISFDASWRPSDKWSLSARIANSNSGEGSTLAGFSNTTGVGYNGNGFSAGPTGAGYLGAANGQFDTRSATVDYKASKRVSVDVHYSETYSTGSLTDNSDIKDLGTAVQWDLGRITVLNIGVDQTSSEFVNSSSVGSTSDTSISMNLNAAPKGNWFYSVGFNTLIAGGSTTYSQNDLSYDLSLGYKLTKRQQVSVSYVRNALAGFEGQVNDQFVLSYTYSIIKRLGLTLAYRINTVTNTDPTDNTGAYRAEGFDLELSYGFRS